MIWSDYIPEDIRALYEVHDYHHAAAILAKELVPEFNEICSALRQFRLTKRDILDAGGNESKIPKRISDIMRPLGWREDKLVAKIEVDGRAVSQETHRVDYLKGRVAFDVEWNSKDQTFDRDLYAFRSFFEFNRISVGVLLTRSDQLEPIFATLGEVVDKHGITRPVKAKYGASTTHMGKLLPRLDSGRNGGCPVLALGMTPGLIVEERT
jgi:CRISPR-associated protein Csd2